MKIDMKLHVHFNWEEKLIKKCRNKSSFYAAQEEYRGFDPRSPVETILATDGSYEQQWRLELETVLLVSALQYNFPLKEIHQKYSLLELRMCLGLNSRLYFKLSNGLKA